MDDETAYVIPYEIFWNIKSDIEGTKLYLDKLTEFTDLQKSRKRIRDVLVFISCVQKSSLERVKAEVLAWWINYDTDFEEVWQKLPEKLQFGHQVAENVSAGLSQMCVLIDDLLKEIDNLNDLNEWRVQFISEVEALEINRNNLWLDFEAGKSMYEEADADDGYFKKEDVLAAVLELDERDERMKQLQDKVDTLGLELNQANISLSGIEAKLRNDFKVEIETLEQNHKSEIQIKLDELSADYVKKTDDRK